MSDSVQSQIVKIGGDTFAFKFTFDCVKELDEGRHHNIFEKTHVLSEGEACPQLVIDVLEVCLTEKNGKPILETESRQVAEYFIEKAGYQTAHTLAQKLLVYFLTGGENGKKLMTMQKAVDFLNQSSDFHLQSFTNRLWLWGYKTAIFGVWIWMLLSEYGLVSLLNKA